MSPPPPPGGKYEPNPNGVNPVKISARADISAATFAPLIADRNLSDEEKRALGPQEVKPGNYGDEFVKYMEEGIAAFTTERIKTMAMATQKLISGLVTRIGLDQEVFTQPGTPIVQSIQNTAANTTLNIKRKQQIQNNLVNQDEFASALNRPPGTANPRDTFLRGPVRSPASNSLNRDSNL